MKTIIAGSRTITKYETVELAIVSSLFDISEVVCGMAAGVDSLGEKWAKTNCVPIQYFPADWRKFGRGAGFIRNARMAEYADALIAIWDGCSKGTANMIDLARRNGLEVHIMEI